jgi:phospholipid/cholesterol/gamma-HCH transport system substrate-binding protein
MSSRQHLEAARLARQRRAAFLLIAVLLGATYAAFVKRVPFTEHYTVSAVFTSANQLKPGSAVRLAGIDIGRVSKLEAGPDGTAVVTMRIDDHDELRADATFSIEPRLLFEGNFYVAVRPGTPRSAALPSGTRIPVGRTDTPVQLDQVLSEFSLPTRRALKSAVGALAEGLGGPAPRGSAGLRRAARELDRALVSVGRVAGAAQGRRPADLRRAVGSTGDVTAQLGRDPAALADLVTNSRRVFATIAESDRAVGATLRALDEVLRRAPRDLVLLDRALPAVPPFAEDLRPVLRAAPQSLNATTGLLRQVKGLMAPGQLPAAVDALEPVTARLPALQKQLTRAFSLLGPAARCIDQTILPALDTVIPDGVHTTGRPIWQEILHFGANLTGTSPGFDGNGGTLRLGLTQGANALQGDLPGIGEVVGQGSIEGVRPVWLGSGNDPQFRPDQWCEDQALPDYGARSRSTPPVGFRQQRLPQPSRSASQRSSMIQELLLGGDGSRERLLQMLVSELPQAPGRKPSPPAGRVSARPRPVTPVVRRPAGPLLPRAPTPAATPPAAPARLTPKVSDVLADVLSALGGGKR